MFRKICKSLIIILFLVVYIAITGIILFGKRTLITYFEGRKTKEFPVLSTETLLDGKFMKEFAEWFNDTIPYRDNIISVYNVMKKYKGIETEIKVIKGKTPEEEEIVSEIEENFGEDTKVDNFNPNIDNPEYDSIVNGGAILYGKGDNFRAMFTTRAFKESDKSYADAINAFAEKYEDIKVYDMICPMAIGYYAPKQYQNYADDLKSMTLDMNKYLSDKVHVVNVYDKLMKHRDEEIFLRTDHHWSPLGAYYAAEEFARVARVKFRDMTYYDEHKIYDYVGSIYRMTGEETINEHKETFVYYTPNVASYSTITSTYEIDNNGNPTFQNAYKESDFFKTNTISKYSAYLVFMGGDNATVKVHIDGNNSKRNLLIIKDSFGDAVPSNLFYSFDNIYIVDYRYFLGDMDTFIKENEVSDILFINSVDSCKNDAAARKYRVFLGKSDLSTP